MKYWLCLAALVLGMVTGAQGQSSRWGSLAQVKPGTTLIVETSNRYGPTGYDRCRMVSVEAGSLTCVERGKPGARLVFPAEQVEFVSRVTKPFHLWPYLVLAVAGIFLGGVSSGSPTAIGVGGFGILIAAIAGGIAAEQRGFDAVMGRPPVADERIQLIYRRIAPPLAPLGPVPGIPLSARPSPEGR